MSTPLSFTKRTSSLQRKASDSLCWLARRGGSAHQIDAATAEDKTVLMVVIVVPLMAWRYVLAHYVLKHGDRWR